MKTIECVKWMWKVSGGVRWQVALCTLLGFLHVAASLSFVWVCKKIVDLVTTDASASLLWYIISMVCCMLMQTIISAAESKVMSRAEIRMKNRLRHEIFSGLMGSRWDGKENFHSGDVLNRMMEDVRVVSEAVVKSLPAVITSGIQFLAAFIFLFILNPDLAWVIPGLMIVMLLLSRSYIRRMRKLNNEIRSSESNLQSLMQESLQYRVVIHTLERTSYITDSVADHQEGLQTQVMNKADYSIFARSMVQIGFAAGYASAFLWGVFGIKAGTATFGMMTAFLQLVGQVQRPIMNLSRQLPSLINSLTSSERLDEVASIPSESTGDSVQMSSGAGLRFNDVTYTYPDSDTPVLQSFTYDFKPGTSTALLGETGIGKSTMIRLILALLTPDKGTVELYDGQNTVSVSPQTRCNMIYVPQGNTLMSGTIRENLLLGDPSASDKQLMDALHIAVADFVMELPQGLDTICGEKGTGLSEGQAQRISIARSLLRKGGILLLDEPTASLDSQTEELFLKRLSERLDGRTLILVTHRQAAASLCTHTLNLSTQ